MTLKMLIFGQLLAYLFVALLFQAKYPSCQPCSFYFATFSWKVDYMSLNVYMCIFFMRITVITRSGNLFCCRRVVAFGGFLTLTS